MPRFYLIVFDFVFLISVVTVLAEFDGVVVTEGGFEGVGA